MLKFIEDLISPGSVQFTFEFFKRDRYHVIMMSSREPGIRGDFKPDPMQQLEILIAQSRRVRPKIVLPRNAVRHADFHDQARLGFGQPLPRITGELRLFVGAEFVGRPQTSLLDSSL